MAKGDEKSSHGAADGCPVEDVHVARWNNRHRIIATASQDFLDRPDQVATVNRSLFRSLVIDAIPGLRGATPEDEDVDRWFVNSSVEKRLLIVRGQQQALRSALAHAVFMELVGDVLPLLEAGEPLVPSTAEMSRDGEYVGDVINIPYRGEYHRFMLAGARWIQGPSLIFTESAKAPDHPHHQLLVATHSAQCTVHGVRTEQYANKFRTAYRGIIRDHGDLVSYRPLFLANFQDMMIPLVAAQKAYLARMHGEGGGFPWPEEITGLVLANLDMLSLPARMKREAALKVISHPVIRYADRPMEDKPFASMPPLFALEDPGDLKLKLAPEFVYLQSARHSFCAGLVAHRSSDPRGRETAERLLAAAGLRSGRPPGSPDYGKIDPITILGIIAARIARDTIFRESPF